MPARRFRVVGKVQGVGFRWWTRALASELGFTGTVRNLEDGSVEVCASASDPVLAVLRARLASGPPGAAVSSVDEEPLTDLPGESFQILH